MLSSTRSRIVWRIFTLFAMLLGLPTLVACCLQASALQAATLRCRTAPCRLQLASGFLPGSDAARLSEAKDVAAWAASCGATSSVAATAVPGCGLGLVATQSVRRGDALFSVPLALGLSAESALRSSIGVYISEFDPCLADYAFIALALLHERRLGEQSAVADWLAATELLPPEGFDDLPLLWTGDTDIMALDAATTAGAAERTKSVRADFEWLAENVFDAEPVFFPPSVFSLEAYTAAVAVAISRSVAVTDEDGFATPVLLPLLDLANHDGVRPTAGVLQRAEKAAGIFGKGAAPACAVLVATEDVDQGDEVCVQYGGGTAGEMLLDHGFVEEPVAPIASVRFAIEDDDRFLDEKTDILETAGLSVEDTWLLVEGEEVAPVSLRRRTWEHGHTGMRPWPWAPGHAGVGVGMRAWA